MKKNLLALIIITVFCASTVKAQDYGLAKPIKSVSEKQEFGLATGIKTKANDVIVPSISMTKQYGEKAILFEDDFSSNLGWTLGSYWAIGAATYEPDVDHSPTSDNGIMACPLGSDYPNGMSRTEAVSPVIDCSGETAVTLSFWSFSGCENDSWDHMGVEVYNGSTWDLIWDNGSSSFQQSEWTYYEFNVTTQAAGNANFQVRFYMGSTDGSVTYSGWAIDDLKVTSPEDHDLGVINISPLIVPLGSNATPQITVQNFGANNEDSYSVDLIIDGAGYDETVTVSTTLTVGSTAVIDMPEWVSPAEGTYTATAYVTVTGDGETSNDTLILDIDVADIQLAYGFNAYGGSVDVGPVNVILPDGTLSSIVASAEDFWSGADWADGIWYAVQYNTNNLLTADPATGTPTTIGTMTGPDFTGLAYDITSDIMYASGYDGINSLLYTVNLATAATTLVGTIQSSALIIGIACDAGGNLYAIDLTNDNLLSIDNATGAGSIIGSLGININYAQDIAYDRDNDILYGTLYVSSGGLYTIDVATGAASLLNTFTSEVTGFAIPYTTTPLGHDLAVKSITPASSMLGDDVLPQVSIKNNGTNIESSFSVNLSIDGTAYDETINITDPINSGETVLIDMPVWTPSAAGTYTATAYVTLTGDEKPSNDTLIIDIDVLDVMIAYGFNAYGGSVAEGPVSITLPDGTLTSIVASAEDFWAGADWADGVWYAVQYNSNNLLTADPATGTPTTIGAMTPYDFTGLAYDVTTGIMYASGYDGSNSLLYTVDLETAATTLVGTILSGSLVIGIACDADGNLYGIDLSNDNLISIDKATGAGSTIGSLGININYAQDIAFDRDNDILYGTLYTTSGGLYEIDVATGAASFLYNFTSEVTGFAIPYSPGEFIVNFTVTDEDANPLDGANISINGTVLTTVSGEASISLANGSYNYVVTMTGYTGEGGTVVVNGANVDEEVILSTPTSINTNDAEIGIFPNPSNGTFIINVDRAYTLEVLSLTGEVLYSRELTGVQNEISLEQAAGTYILRLTNKDETLFSRIVIE